MKKMYAVMTLVLALAVAQGALAGETWQENTMFSDDDVAYIKNPVQGDAHVQSREAIKDKVENTLLDDSDQAYIQNNGEVAETGKYSKEASAPEVIGNTMFDEADQAYFQAAREKKAGVRTATR